MAEGCREFCQQPLLGPETLSGIDDTLLVLREMLSGLAETPTLVIGTHFAGRTAGRVVRDGDAFRLAV